MSKARLVLTALFVDHQTPAEVAQRYGVHRSWVYRLKARYQAEGETALEPRSRRPHTNHDRVRHDRIDKTGCVTLRHHGRLHHIGVGRAHTGTHVILLAQDRERRIVNAITGELLRGLTLDPDRDYQPTAAPTAAPARPTRTTPTTTKTGPSRGSGLSPIS